MGEGMEEQEHGESDLHGTPPVGPPESTPDRRRHTDVLLHLLGHLKRALDAPDRAELVDLIETYPRREVPLIVPITLLRHHFRRHGTDWVRNQTYLSPCAGELMLRNHV